MPFNLERVDGREIAVPTRPHLWRLLEALAAPYDRHEGQDPALAGAPVLAAQEASSRRDVRVIRPGRGV